LEFSGLEFVSDFEFRASDLNVSFEEDCDISVCRYGRPAVVAANVYNRRNCWYNQSGYMDYG